MPAGVRELISFRFLRKAEAFTMTALRPVWNEFGRKKQLPEGCFFVARRERGSQRLFLRRQTVLSRPFPSQYTKYETISAQGIAGCGALPGFLLLLPAALLVNRRQPQPGGRGGRRGPERGLRRGRGERKQPRLRLSGLSDTKGCRARLAAGPLPQPAASDSPASESSL